MTRLAILENAVSGNKKLTGAENLRDVHHRKLNAYLEVRHSSLEQLSIFVASVLLLFMNFDRLGPLL